MCLLFQWFIHFGHETQGCVVPHDLADVRGTLEVTFFRFQNTLYNDSVSVIVTTLCR